MNAIFRKDLAASYGVNLRTIDRWARERLLPSPRRTPAGRPYWTDKQIQLAESRKISRITKAEKCRARKAARLLKKKMLAAARAARAVSTQLLLPVKF